MAKQRSTYLKFLSPKENKGRLISIYRGLGLGTRSFNIRRGK